MKTTDFCKQYHPCRDGMAFALQYDTMTEVWEACQRPDWLFWIMEKHAPLEKVQAVRLAIAYAESCIGLYTSPSEAPRQAIEAAKAWLADPSEENRRAADAAADAAAWAARAARAAADAANCDLFRSIIPNPFL